jgi:hypothetical protein
MRSQASREPKRVALQVRIDARTKEQLAKLAVQRDCPVSQLVREGIRQVLNPHNDQAISQTERTHEPQAPTGEETRADETIPLQLVPF